MKVYDCMAMAKPIVASAISDLPSTLEGCGLLVPPGEVAPLTNALSDLLNNPEAAHALGAKARARCLENYSIQVVGKKLASVSEKLMQISP
jgi:glycosyltransferase involved in cell wall biosynthesis